MVGSAACFQSTNPLVGLANANVVIADGSYSWYNPSVVGGILIKDRVDDDDDDDDDDAAPRF